MKVLKNSFKISVLCSVFSGKLVRLSVLLLLTNLLIISGCSKEEVAPVVIAPAKKIVAPVQAVVTGIIKPEYKYNSIGKRDPFKTFVVEKEKKVRSVAPMSPLQSFDIGVLKLVGVMILPDKKVAIIEDPTGKGYHVKFGTHIGLNEGIVVDILQDELVIEEKYLDEIGATKAKRVSIKIPREPGQGGEGR